MNLFEQLGIADMVTVLKKDPRQNDYLDCFVKWYTEENTGHDYERAESLLCSLSIPENIYSIYTKLSLDGNTGLPYHTKIGYFLAAAFNYSGKPLQFVRDIGQKIEGLGTKLAPGKSLIVDGCTSLLCDRASGGKIINRGHVHTVGYDKKNFVIENHGVIRRLHDLRNSVVLNYGTIDHVVDAHDTLILDFVGGIRTYSYCNSNTIIENARVSVKISDSDENICVGEQFWERGHDVYNMHLFRRDPRLKETISKIQAICQDANGDLDLFNELLKMIGGNRLHLLRNIREYLKEELDYEPAPDTASD